MKAVIMAGGRGTRIAPIANDIPKPMIRLCGKPVLEYQINCLGRNGLNDIIIVIGHLGTVIQDYFEEGTKFGVHISYIVETVPLGTAGALYRTPGLEDDFILLCGDIIFDLDFSRLIAFHRTHGAWATLVSHANEHPYDSSILITETLPPSESGGMPRDTCRVIQWLTKEDSRIWVKNRVNAGIEVISPELLLAAHAWILTTDEDRKAPGGGEEDLKLDLDRDILKPQISSGRIYAYNTPEYIKDMGTPDRYYTTEADIKSGLITQRNLKHSQKAIFLARDGTLNRDVGFITRAEQLELLPGAAEAVRKINKSGYLAILVTNQPVIARGDCTFEELAIIHNRLETLLGIEGAFLDAIYFCPHYPEKGFLGGCPGYKCACSCRKPSPGMLLKAANDFNIELSTSFMIGNSRSDMEAGENAGCIPVMIRPGYTLADFVSEKNLSK
jgi:D,D-heptose 1,7-bisphosphate phosphatase